MNHAFAHGTPAFFCHFRHNANSSLFCAHALKWTRWSAQLGSGQRLPPRSASSCGCGWNSFRHSISIATARWQCGDCNRFDQKEGFFVVARYRTQHRKCKHLSVANVCDSNRRCSDNSRMTRSIASNASNHNWLTALTVQSSCPCVRTWFKSLDYCFKAV